MTVESLSTVSFFVDIIVSLLWRQNWVKRKRNNKTQAAATDISYFFVNVLPVGSTAHGYYPDA